MKIIKPFILSFFIFIITGIVFGQQDRNSSRSIETSVSYNYLENIQFDCLLLYGLKQHEPFIGIGIPLNKNHVSNYGVSAGYKFYPNKKTSDFDLFFMFLLRATSRKLYSNSSSNGFSLHNLVGYGFTININDKVCVKHHLAAGIENSWFKGYDAFNDLSLEINIGIGFKLFSVKPKE